MTLLLDAAGVTENTGGSVLWDLVYSPKQCGLLLKQVLVKKIILFGINPCYYPVYSSVTQQDHLHVSIYDGLEDCWS